METNQAKLYDRQIQIFGADTQKTINTTEVMVSGLNTVTTETVKNLALIGFNIALIDKRPLSSSDIECSPLLGVSDEEMINQPIDQVIRTKLLDINPHITVRIAEEPVETSVVESNIFISIDQSFEVQRSISAKLKDHNIPKFYLFQNDYTFLAFVELTEKSFRLSSYSSEDLQKLLKAEFNIDYDFNAVNKPFVGDFVLQGICGATFNQTILTLVSRQKLDYNLLYMSLNQESENPSDHRKLECLNIK